MARNNQTPPTEIQVEVPPRGPEPEVASPSPEAEIVMPMSPMSRMEFNLEPCEERCIKCQGYVLAITGTDETSQTYLADWENWCPRCQAVVLTLSQASAEMARPMKQGQVGFLASWPLPLAVERKRAGGQGNG